MASIPGGIQPWFQFPHQTFVFLRSADIDHSSEPGVYPACPPDYPERRY